MSDDGFTLTDEARFAAGAGWFGYLERIDPFRPDLFRYCRRLTGNVWDAEDLVQDTIEKGFARLASVHHTVDTPRAYMLRIASNLWVDRIRRSTSEAAAVAREASDPTQGTSTPPADRLAVRDAGAVLLQELAPQERAALVLKEVFELSLDETASVLGTTVGAVKSALHRGRNRLRADEETRKMRPVPKPEAVERFVDRYNQRDLPGLLELMLDDAAVEMYGHVYEVGREAFTRKGGWFDHNFTNPFDGKPSDAFWEVVHFQGEPVVLVQYGAEGERVVGGVMRFEEIEGRIARIRVYALCPDVVDEVAGELGRPVGPLRMYRFPFPMEGA